MEIARHWNKILFHDAPDPRVKDWPLLGSPVSMILIAGTWLWLVLRAGPRFMKDRKPFKLRGLIQAINVLQILVNSYMTYEFLDAGWLNGYTLGCQPCDHSLSPSALRMARACYIFLIVKLSDLIDTLIYVLRGKSSQITFLHLYHHIVILLFAWIVCNYEPGGIPTFTCVTNSFVHVVMYLYYLLASLGPHFEKYLWWKKYLTGFQMVQFVVQIAHALYSLTRANCDFPKSLIYTFIPVTGMLLLLFINFYSQTYRKKGNKLNSKKPTLSVCFPSKDTSGRSLDE